VSVKSSLIAIVIRHVVSEIKIDIAFHYTFQEPFYCHSFVSSIVKVFLRDKEEERRTWQTKSLFIFEVW
jgi:hypothetical protein